MILIQNRKTKIKKAQAGLEFLTTYGWALLIILIASAALIQLDIISIKPPSTCSSSPPIGCADVLVDEDGNITLVLTSNFVKYANIVQFSLKTPVTAT